MYKIIENIRELNEILKTMNGKEKNRKIYNAGYTMLHVSVDEDGQKDEYRASMNFFVVSDSKDSEENIGKEFFNMITGNECKVGAALGFDVDMEEETIEINVSETETKYLFNFWNSAPLPKDMVEWLISGITG